MMPLELFAAPEPDPEQQKAIDDYRAAVQAAQVAERELVTGRWACLYCTCALRRRPAQGAQEGCLVHGGFLLTPDGRAF